jgi:hypothetical protein
MREVPISNCEREFILSLISDKKLSLPSEFRMNYFASVHTVYLHEPVTLIINDLELWMIYAANNLCFKSHLQCSKEVCDRQIFFFKIGFLFSFYYFFLPACLIVIAG